MLGLDWSHLRPFKGSVAGAFEELCTQLAACEPVQTGARFTRVAAPDAGKECIWRLASGEERAWQAKFFLQPPGKVQWRQLDASVKRVLSAHPDLATYTVCLPIDRADPKVAGQDWFLDEWKKHVTKWERWAASRSMQVQFEYWGNHEIVERLSREEHRGRTFFWFNTDYFSHEWFRTRLDETLANAGPRYTPDLRLDLPIARNFDGLSRTPEFYAAFRSTVRELRKAGAWLPRPRDDWPAKAELSTLRECVDRLCAAARISEQGVHAVDWGALSGLVAQCRNAIRSLDDAIRQFSLDRGNLAGQQVAEGNGGKSLDDLSHYARRLWGPLAGLSEFIEGTPSRLFNQPALLLVGDAGTGKTHLLCDIGSRWIDQGRAAIVLLGGQFREADPWPQIVSALGLACPRDEFLGALNAAGEAAGTRVLLCIDALNEGDGKRLWSSYLGGFCVAVSRYPWIGLCVSVRTSYLDVVVPRDLEPKRLVKVKHAGFAGYELEATRAFFEYYGIECPSIPLLVPEFDNPLFLKIFCAGLRESGRTRLPEGETGIKSVFDLFLNAVNEKLARPSELDLNPKANFVQKAVDVLADELARGKRPWIPHGTAEHLVNEVAPPAGGYEDSLFRRLIAEGVLSEDRFLAELTADSYRYEEGVRFSYERLADFLVACRLLEAHVRDTASAEPAAPPVPCFSGVLESETTASWNQGVIELLSVLVPERLGKELVDVVPQAAALHSVRQAFVDSLLWRSSGSFSAQTLDYVNRSVLRYRDTYESFLRSLIMLSVRPGHPWNADFLDRRLSRDDMPGRDGWWSVFLSNEHSGGLSSPVARLIDWARSPDIEQVQDEPARLAATALTWFLTTSNRHVRDQATKGLVNLLSTRLPVLCGILKAFSGVDDPYVSERLYAVAYGCSMRNGGSVELGALAQLAYDLVFREGTPPANVLLRDYARGVIERALALGLSLHVQHAAIRPPYGSSWPTIPSDADVRQLGERLEGAEDAAWAQVALFDSVMGFGDFARYVVGTNTPMFEWSSQRLDQRRRRTRRERYDSFVATLGVRARRALERYESTLRVVRFPGSGLADLIKTKTGAEADQELLQVLLTIEEGRLKKVLGRERGARFEADARPYLESPPQEEFAFDLSLLQRWIIRRVHDLGWSVERFGAFDRALDSWGREANKAERIGKKYQWIAYYEILARVADNFRFRERLTWPDREGVYRGPWQLGYVRNIDPSVVGPRATSRSAATRGWWERDTERDWGPSQSDAKWLASRAGLPDPKEEIVLTRSTDNSRWAVLHRFLRWHEDCEEDNVACGPLGREVWISISAFIVRSRDFDRLARWARRTDVTRRLGPHDEQRDLHRVFLGEAYWSEAHKVVCDASRSCFEWAAGKHGPLAVPATTMSDAFLGEWTYDCSGDDDQRLDVPSDYLAHAMGLRWSGRDGEFVDGNDKVVCLAPPAENGRAPLLLAECDAMKCFLAKKRLRLVWLVRGEKNAYGQGDWPKSFIGRHYLSGLYSMRPDGSVMGSLKGRVSRD